MRAKAPQIAQGGLELVVTAVFLMGYYTPHLIGIFKKLVATC